MKIRTDLRREAKSIPVSSIFTFPRPWGVTTVEHSSSREGAQLLSHHYIQQTWREAQMPLQHLQPQRQEASRSLAEPCLMLVPQAQLMDFDMLKALYALATAAVCIFVIPRPPTPQGVNATTVARFEVSAATSRPHPRLVGVRRALGNASVSIGWLTASARLVNSGTAGAQRIWSRSRMGLSNSHFRWPGLGEALR